ncbi:MAG: FG-GAP repeat domain-containing protein [Lewinella sp.]
MGAFNVASHPRMLGDTNGDGTADIIGFAQEGVYVALADGAGSFYPKKLVIRNLTNGNGGWSVAKHPRCVGDVNGDGKVDVIGFGDRGVFVSFAR